MTPRPKYRYLRDRVRRVSLVLLGVLALGYALACWGAL